MAIYETHFLVGPDGILRIKLPLGGSVANREVKVTIESLDPPSAKAMEGWRMRVLALAGSIPDPAFLRHDQGQVEDRGEMFP